MSLTALCVISSQISFCHLWWQVWGAKHWRMGGKKLREAAWKEVAALVINLSITKIHYESSSGHQQWLHQILWPSIQSMWRCVSWDGAGGVDRLTDLHGRLARCPLGFDILDAEMNGAKENTKQAHCCLTCSLKTKNIVAAIWPWTTQQLSRSALN